MTTTKQSIAKLNLRIALSSVWLALALIGWPAAAQTTATGRAAVAGNHPAEVESMPSLGEAPADQQLTMEVRFAVRNPAALEQLLQQQQDPTSPNFHHWLTPQQYTAQFGPTAQQFSAVQKWLSDQGFQIHAADPSTATLKFSGSVAQAEGALQTSIQNFGNLRLYANISDPQVPAEFAGVIEAIRGLDNMRRAKPVSGRMHHPPLHRDLMIPQPSAAPLLLTGLSQMSRAAFFFDSEVAGARAGTSNPLTRQQTTQGQVQAFAPNDVYNFYNEHPLLSAGINGSGSDCIAIVADSDFPDADIAAFDNAFGVTPPVITRVGTNPGINSKTPAEEEEALIDVEWAHALAPGAPIKVFFFSPVNGQIENAIQAAVSDNTCSVINVSFELCGGAPTNSIYAQAASQGQSVMVASGDQGAAGVVVDPQSMSCVPSSSLGVNELAANPNVTAVGGTQFFPNFDQNGVDSGFVTESVWNDNAGASGGGSSAIFSKPAYQAGLVANDGMPNNGMRYVPDVSIGASPSNPGFFLGEDSKGSPLIACCFGGTSIAAPMWSGIVRVLEQLAGSRNGLINTRLYSLAQSNNNQVPGMRDVTSGNNSFPNPPVTGFSAAPGYDRATGWGTPDITGFVDAFGGAVFSASVATVTANKGVGVTVGPFSIQNQTTNPLTVNSVVIALGNSSLFSGNAILTPVNPSGSASTVPASSSMSFSVAIQIPSRGAQSFTLTLTPATAATSAMNSGAPTLAGLAPLSPRSAQPGLALATVVLLILGMALRRRLGRAERIAMALVTILTIAALASLGGCGGGGGGGSSAGNNALPSSTVTLTNATIMPAGGSAFTLPANTFIGTIKVK